MKTTRQTKARRESGGVMNLTNDSYLILIGTKKFTERYCRDEGGWLKVSARGRTFRMTAEQVLNHLLPAVAGLKPGVIVEVQHQPRGRPHRRRLPARPTASRAPSRRGTR